jgi:acyl-CoA synthetase (AMP-forming)/AMP-acid ligase II
MTEANCLCSTFDYPEADDTGSVGYLRPGMDGKLVDDNGKDISAYDVIGEMCVRGPLIIPGYFNADGKDGGVNRKDWDADGFYHTGDMMYCDGQTKKLYIVDRKKELIKVRGFQVAPPELEGLLLQMPGVVDCAVIGVKEKDGEGEVPRAYVIRRPGYQPAVTEEEIKSFVKKNLASFKRLDGGVRFVDSIPKTASGKILKRIMRDEAKAEGRTEGAKL